MEATMTIKQTVDITESEFNELRYTPWSFERSSYMNCVDTLTIYDERTGNPVAGREIHTDGVDYYKYKD